MYDVMLYDSVIGKVQRTYLVKRLYPTAEFIQSLGHISSHLTLLSDKIIHPLPFKKKCENCVFNVRICHYGGTSL